MDARESIIQAATKLIVEKGERMDEITVREICARAGVGLGLVNYHFGSKERLIEVCVERIINGIVARFGEMKNGTTGMPAFDRLAHLGGMTLDYLFEHEAVARVSILADMRTPKPDDNTSRTFLAYVPLVAACRPDWDEVTVRRKTLLLITTVQQIFLRHEAVGALLGVDLSVKENRHALHERILRDVLVV